MVWEIT